DSFSSGTSPFVPAEHGYEERHRIEFCVDLTLDTAALWQAMRKDQREKVRRLGREGVTLDAGSRPDDLGGLQLTREATRVRRTGRGQRYERSPEVLYEHLSEYLVKRGAGRLFVARLRGETIAAIFFVTFNGRACSIFSGSTEAGYRLGAQSGLFWTAVETFKAEGFIELNRGGVPASAAEEGDALQGIYLFKLRLGATPRLCRSGEKVVSPVRHYLRGLTRGLGRLGVGA
ncbi:MAG: GNAT family N-acetyltransferase, partial [Candidatus Rokuibacteriota bacterium]